MNADEVRIHVVERPPWVAQHSFVAPGKSHYAFAVTGHGSSLRVEASGYGNGEAEALADLEHTVTVPVVKEKPTPRVGRKRAAPINHLPVPDDPVAPFYAKCTAEGCGRNLIRVYGVQARRANFRHLKLKGN